MKHFLVVFKAIGSKTISAILDADSLEAAKVYFNQNFTGCSLLAIEELNI